MIRQLLVYRCHCCILGCKIDKKIKKESRKKNIIKFTFGFNGLPFNVKFHQDLEMISEDLALGDILKEYVADKKALAVFD